MKTTCPHCKDDPNPVSGQHANGLACRVFDATGKFWKLSFEEISKCETRVVAFNNELGLCRLVAVIKPAGFIRVMMNYHVLRYITRIVDPSFAWNPNHLSDLTAHVVKMENRTKINVTNLRSNDEQKKGWRKNDRKTGRRHRKA